MMKTPEQLKGAIRNLAKKKGIPPSSQSIHSCTSSCSIFRSSRTCRIFSLSSRAAHQAMPQPADMLLGTGISLPGALCSRQAFSIAIASAVV